MFTGERILPKRKFNVTFQQSLFAYEFARRRSVGKRVLDVGSGEGYGTAYLAEKAAEVVGLDMHAGAVAKSREKYSASNIRFVVGKMEMPPQELVDEKFDMVCCFQTIEHVSNQDLFLEQLKQYAKPGAEVIITTPNKGRFPGFNPYHVRELTPQELVELMRSHFSWSEVWGVFGDEKVLKYRNSKQRISDAILKIDIYSVRELLPRQLVLSLYGLGTGLVKTLSYKAERAAVAAVDLESFWVSRDSLEQSLDLLAVGRV